MSSTLLDKPPEAPQRARRWWVLSASFAAVVVLTAAVTFLLARSGNDHSATPPVPAPSASQSTAVQVPAPIPTPTAGTASPSPVVPAFRYLPLWPFDSVADAIAWQKEALPGGHQPWRLSPDLTALAFTTGYLQFTTVDQSLGTTVNGDEAWVRVGRRAENGTDLTAAVVHLARIGSGANQPWEVVGTRDETLSLTTPAYRASITSPVTVGGRITGVDESVRIQVRGTGETGVLGEVAGIPAGGENQPWTAQVSFHRSTGTVRTIIVSTGSHVGPGVGRFAITGVRVR
jgi:hypothetical protein